MLRYLIGQWRALHTSQICRQIRLVPNTSELNAPVSNSTCPLHRCCLNSPHRIRLVVLLVIHQEGGLFFSLAAP
jgi:hypothetical protein